MWTQDDSASFGGHSEIEHALTVLANLLGEDGHTFELVVIGGAALNVLGFVSRPTKDVDILGLRLYAEGARVVKVDPLPAELADAAARAAADLGLDPSWLNAGPTDVLDWGLPEGFESRLTQRSYGPRLLIHFPSRVDLISLKVYAAADAGVGRHTADLQALGATCPELVAGANWARTHDPSPSFCRLLSALLRYFECPEAEKFERGCDASE